MRRAHGYFCVNTFAGGQYPQVVCDAVADRRQKLEALVGLVVPISDCVTFTK